MNRHDADRIAAAILYEGYALYPYRRTSVKNRQRWSFGGVHPPAWAGATAGSEPSTLWGEFILRGDHATRLAARLRFLHLLTRDPSGDAWHEGLEREVVTPELPLAALAGDGHVTAFTLPSAVPAAHFQAEISGELVLRATPLAAGVHRVALAVRNTTAFVPGALDEDAPAAVRHARRGAALLRTLTSTHALLAVRSGEFVSLQDPPDDCRAAAAGCTHGGLWPILLGRERASDALLLSPIILSDCPAVAPESPGDLFDATEIDEILTLRILTLSDDEQREMAALDPRTRALLERAAALTPEQRTALHGAERASGPRVAPGARVRLRPGGRADVFDVALAGRAATVLSIERTNDGETYCAVTVDDDPGRDLGADGQPGHRFFFRPDEVEPLE